MGAKIEWTDRTSVLAAVAAYGDIVRQEVFQALSVAGDLVVAGVIEKSPVSDGTFTSSISATDPHYDSLAGWGVDVGDNCNYGEVLENGREPGSRMPPVEPLTMWVISHLRFFPGVETEEQAEGVALNIARKIAKRGFAPPHTDGWKMYYLAARDGGRVVGQVESVFARAARKIAARCEKAA